MQSFRLLASAGRNVLRRTAGAATSINGIRLEHGERPRFDVFNGRSRQFPVNETKPALFSAAGNERFAIDADAERFAMMTAILPAKGAKLAAPQRTYCRSA